MPYLKLNTKDLALICCFAPLYTVFSLLSIFPIIGAPGKFISLGAVMAPIIGLILGPYLGATTTSLGGIIGWAITQTGPFGLLSFVPAGSASLCAGLLGYQKARVCIFLYSALLLMVMFYPFIGPAMLYPYYSLFQLVGLVVLVSPLRLKAAEYVNKHTSLLELGFGVGVISFIAALFGQIAGNLLFEVMYWPAIYPTTDYWRGLWQFLTFLYPFERTTISLIATLIGTPIIKTLKTMDLRWKRE